MTQSVKVVVRDPFGLHLRAAAKLILLLRNYQSRILFRKDRVQVDGRSILGVLNLAAAYGTELEVILEGEDAGEALSGIRRFFQEPRGWT